MGAVWLIYTAQCHAVYSTMLMVNFHDQGPYTGSQYPKQEV